METIKYPIEAKLLNLSEFSEANLDSPDLYKSLKELKDKYFFNALYDKKELLHEKMFFISLEFN